MPALPSSRACRTSPPRSAREREGGGGGGGRDLEVGGWWGLGLGGTVG